MRIYVPSTTTDLRALLDAGELGPAPLTAFAVTPGLRDWYIDDDVESLEYAAQEEAARGSLRLIDADLTAARRRVVVAAEVSGDLVQVRDDLERGVVQVEATIPLGAIASVHVDDADAESTVTRAAQSIIAADLGDPGSQEAVDDASGFELSWYATQEIGPLLELL